MKNELMMIIINKEGIITGMYSDEEYTRTNSVDELLKYIRAKNEKGMCEEDFDYLARLFCMRFCMRRYAEDNYPDMELSENNLTMYYKLVQQGDILFINYRASNNLLLVPSETTDEQKQVLRDITRAFDPNITWTMCDNVYSEVFNYNDKVYGAVSFANERDGSLAPYIDYLLKKEKIKSIEN